MVNEAATNAKYSVNAVFYHEMHHALLQRESCLEGGFSEVF